MTGWARGTEQVLARKAPPLVFLGVLLASSACVGVDDAGSPNDPFHPDVVAEGWLVEVSVSPSRVGPLSVSLGELEADLDPDDPKWLSHIVTFVNVAEEVVRLEEVRASTFLRRDRDPVLLVADAGCGWVLPRGGKPVKPGVCFGDLVIAHLETGESFDQAVFLNKDLPGMEQLVEGTYVFHK